MSLQGGFTVSSTQKIWSWQTGLNHLVRWVTEQNRCKPFCRLLQTPDSILVFIMLQLHNLLLHDISSFWCLVRCRQPAGLTRLNQLDTSNENICVKAYVLLRPEQNKQGFLSWIFFFQCHFFQQDSEGNLKGAEEELQISSDEYAPSGSDDEYEHTLDCGPSGHTQPHKPEGQDHHIPKSKDESLEPNPSKRLTDTPSKTGVAAPAEEETEEFKVPFPVPKPRFSRQTTPSPQPSPPTAKPRTLHILNPSTPEKHSSPTPTKEISKPAPDSRPKQSLRKLQLTDEEKTQLVNLQSFSADSDSETPGGSSSCSSSSATAGGPSPPKPEGLDGQEEEGYWSGSTAGHIREKRNRRCFRRKEMPSGQTRVRSKFSPWNLSSPRISRDTRLSVLVSQPGRVGTLKNRRHSELSRRKKPLLWCFWDFIQSGFILTLSCFSTTETTFRHVHSASEEGVDGDDDDDDDDDDDEMFEQDADLFDEKVRSWCCHVT